MLNLMKLGRRARSSCSKFGKITTQKFRITLLKQKNKRPF
nr:MAG TPA: hypothetical protein [Caudoviricetes sp.]